VIRERGRCSARSTRSGIALVALLVVGNLLCALGCQAKSQHPQVAVDFKLPSGEVSPTFSMEVVSTPSSRGFGLMFRRELAERSGMLFIFPTEEVQSFWMKNTLIPLDMVFVSKDLRVVGVLERVPPLTEDARKVDAPSTYVLEFAGGTMGKFGIKVGSVLNIQGALPRPL